ncbi:hypothetical protein EZV62_016407 [Acer yangbiense]|uniref:Uncharacterized protein n=1 Tax=Acer yangbiense TaxID=1000413 RepID=A0A5C7HP57_9ROSI|nr:hypothetical protein EZV62_016407 [Acer yangbiense]
MIQILHQHNSFLSVQQGLHLYHSKFSNGIKRKCTVFSSSHGRNKKIPKSVAIPSCPSHPVTSQPESSSSPSSFIGAAALRCHRLSESLPARRRAATFLDERCFLHPPRRTFVCYISSRRLVALTFFSEWKQVYDTTGSNNIDENSISRQLSAWTGMAAKFEVDPQLSRQTHIIEITKHVLRPSKLLQECQNDPVRPTETGLHQNIPQKCSCAPGKGKWEDPALHRIGSALHVHPVQVGVKVILGIACSTEAAHIFTGQFDVVWNCARNTSGPARVLRSTSCSRIVVFTVVRTSIEDTAAVEVLAHSTAGEASVDSIVGILGNRGGTLEACIAFDMGSIRIVMAVVIGPLRGEVDFVVLVSSPPSSANVGGLTRPPVSTVVVCPRGKVLRKVISGRPPPFHPADKWMVDLRYSSKEETSTDEDEGTHPSMLSEVHVASNISESLK